MEEDIIWEWFDKKAWVAYDAVTAQILEQAFIEKAKTLILDHGFFSSGPYIVDFVKMEQTNNRTKFIRALRRSTGKATRSIATWECKVKKKWTSYDMETSKILEDSFCQGKPKVTLEHGFYAENGPYVIDFVEMKQMNTQSGFAREIRRQVDAKTEITPQKREGKIKKMEGERDRRNSLMPRASPIGQVPPEKLKPCYGTIGITLRGARDLAGVNPLGSDPFVVVTTDFSAYVEKTEWKFKTSHPVWNQTFQIPVSRWDMEGNVIFTVYDFHHLKKNVYLGRLDVPLYDIVASGDMSSWMPLNYEARKKSKKQPRGNLDLTIKFLAKPQPEAAHIDLGNILKSANLQFHQQMAEKVATTRLENPSAASSTARKYTMGIKQGRVDGSVGQYSPTHYAGGSVPGSGSPRPSPSGGGKNVSEKFRSWAPNREIVEFADPNVLEGENTKYTLGDLLGEGGFAIVKRAINITTKEPVAVKIIQKTIQADAEAIALIIREIQILHLIQNETCVSFIESRETHDNIFIVMEFVGGGDLLDAILGVSGFEEPVSARAIHDILQGLDYLHSVGICHRDMKPENVLYHPDLHVWKIADFGCATLFTEERPFMTEFEGTIQYMAPEILIGDKYTKSVDIWATGVITYVSLSACFPWEGKTDHEVQESIMSYNIKFYSPEFDKVCQDGIGFILKLLEPNIDKRITIEQALNHPWMKQQLAQ